MPKLPVTRHTGDMDADRTHDARLDAAFAAVPRAAFLPERQRGSADLDQALPIGHSATNSQPWTVRYMLARLDVRPGHRVLDVGSGSGWTAALLAHLAGPEGSVVGVDVVPELVAMAREHLAGIDTGGLGAVRIEQAEPGVLGWPAGGPYDRILVSADGRRVPAELEQQLAAGGRMVLPAAHTMVVVQRGSDGTLTRAETGDLFTFVPLR